jgi:cytochrome c-type biogenesis protein CcmF
MRYAGYFKHFNVQNKSSLKENHSTLKEGINQSEEVNSKPSQVISLVSRESFILFSTILLLVATLTVLLGTLFPLILDSLTGQKISVGFPYFNTVFIPLILPVLFFIPLGPLSFWGENYLYPNIFPLAVLLGLFLASWIILGTLKFAVSKIKKSGNLFKLSGGAIGMILAHTGIGVTIIGITLVSHYQLEKEVNLALKESVTIGSYQIQFADIQRIQGANFVGYLGHFKIAHTNHSDKNSTSQIIHLYPEKRTFVVQELTMTEMAIDWGWFRDLDIALGEKLDKDHWSVRMYYKPFIRWIWFGALMMALGGLCAAYGRRLKKNTAKN